MDISETIVVYDAKVGWYITLMRMWPYMNIEGQGYSMTLDQGHSDSTFSFSEKPLGRLKPTFM